ncbi:hypothetical protein H5410_002563 [Solanum commersonii]|uniref:Uncharacterized protein n=1 Tax=Solanum commersonii TaxID=4109 RepID=A0A9J6B299_SOLCO|nr:hypothetical protein H5410_002563 [Solanum commersonii]
MVLGQYLGHGTLIFNNLRHFHKPFYESCSSPLAVKWPVKLRHFGAAQDRYLPSHHEPHH